MSGPRRGASSGRPSKGFLPTGDFIALGNKPVAGSVRQVSPNPTPPVVKKPHLLAPPTSSNRSSEEREEGGGLFSDPIRLSQVPFSKTPGEGSGQAKSPLTTTALPPLEVRSSELLSAVKDAIASRSQGKVDQLIGGALKQLKNARLKGDPNLNSALAALATESPHLFSSTAAVKGLVSVLKRESASIFKTRSEPTTYTMACQLLAVALNSSYDWPEAVAKVYIEDAMNERVWVDLDNCKKLTDNVCTIFNTKSADDQESDQAVVTMETSSSHQGGDDITPIVIEEDMRDKSEQESETKGFQSLLDAIEVHPRFSLSVCRSLHAHVMQLVKEQLGKRGVQAADNIFRNQLRFLATATGLPEIRLFVAERFEQWIQNPKMIKLVQDLLMAVAINCYQHTPEDVRVMELLANVRLKTRLFSQHFVACMKELISSHPDNLNTVLRRVVANELTQQVRTGSNLLLLTMMIHSWPEESCKLLGEVFQDFLARKEDYLRALRSFLRELVKQVKTENFPYVTFTRALMQERKETHFLGLDQTHKERLASALADLMAFCCMMTANLLIREAYVGYSKGERAMVPQLKEFFGTLGIIQRDAVWWVHTILPNFLRPQPTDYKSCLRKVLFLEPAESYHEKDSWPPESDRGTILHLMTEAMLQSDTLMRVLVIGLSRDLPLQASDALDIVDKLVARAANAHSADLPRLPVVECKELFHAILNITTYRPPTSIQLPPGYKPPELAISKLYWKGWILLLVLSAFNPKTVGSVGWSEYPTLRGMMEMVMTNNYTFPTSMTLSIEEDGTLESVTSAKTRELQLLQLEKDAILEYESHLAASSSNQTSQITESNSFLINQVTLLAPKEPARRLHPSVVELIKTVNQSLRLGQLLCRCREPDFLLDIIQRQGTSESMNWLRELVEGSHSSLEVLPVPCLCEFLLTGYQERGVVASEAVSEADSSSHRSQFKRRQRGKEKALQQHEQLVGRLQTLLYGPSASLATSSEVLRYFFDKLAHSRLLPRQVALKALDEILSPTKDSNTSYSQVDDTEEDELPVSSNVSSWLLTAIPSLPYFPAMVDSISDLVLHACETETTTGLLLGYLAFISNHYSQNSLATTAIELALVINTRFPIIKKIFSPSQLSSLSMVKPLPLSTLTALLGMLRRALDLLIHQDCPAEVESESVVVSFSHIGGSNQTSLPLSLLEATLLVLSLTLPKYCEDVQYLLELLCPALAVAVETKRPSSLVSIGTWKQVFCGQCVQLVQMTLPHLDVQLLKLLVSLNGVPLSNMETLLAFMDQLADPLSVDENFLQALGESVSLIPSIESQRLRGCKSGSVFLALIEDRNNCQASASNQVAELLEPIDLCQEQQIPKQATEDEILLTPSPSTVLAVVRELLSPSTSPPRLMSQLLVSLQQMVLQLHKKGKQLSHLQVSCLESLVANLHNLLASNRSKVKIISERCPISLSLFRLLTRALLLHGSPKLLNDYRALVGLVLDGSTGVFATAMQACASQLGIKKSSSKKSPSVVLEERGRKEIASDIDNHRLLGTCEEMAAKGCVRVERVLKMAAKRAIMEGKENQCIQLLTKLHIKIDHSPLVSLSLRSSSAEDTDDTDAGMDWQASSDISSNLCIQGMTADLIEILDPEVIIKCPKEVQGFLFTLPGSGNIKHSDLQVPGVNHPEQRVQTYLLERLIHQTSWPTLREGVAAALDSELVADPCVVPSAVLDFLWACLQAPSLWQGKVKKEALIDSSLSMNIDRQSYLHLSDSQLCSMVDHVLNEVSGNAHEEVESVLSSRLPLLMCCCQAKDDSLTTMVQHVLCFRGPSEITWRLLVQLYLADERVIQLVDQDKLSLSALKLSLPAKLDPELHTLLSAMTDASSEKKSVQKMNAAGHLCRQLATTHPILLLRQLPMLGWLLRGRAHLVSKQFQNENHHHVFNNSFQLVEIMQPQVFMMGENFNAFLEPFFDFIKFQCLEQQKSYSLVGKMSSLLLNYLQHNRQGVTVLVEQHRKTLQALAEGFPKQKSTLQPLLDLPPLTASSGSQDSITQPDTLLENPMIVFSPATGQPHSYEMLLPFLKKLEYGQSQEGAANVLQDLDDSSMRTVEILKHFVPELCRIIQEPDHMSKKIAHELLLRYVRHFPSSIKEVLPSVHECLESSDHSVVMATMASIPDLALLCSGLDAALLLNKLFALSLTPTLHCGPELIKAVRGLTLHSST